MTYRDKLRVMQFLTTLGGEYKPLRASLHTETFPHLKNVVVELLSKDTQLGILKNFQSHVMTYTGVLVLSQSDQNLRVL